MIETPDLDYQRFKRKVLALTGIDLDVYKQNQMERRLRYLLERHHCESFHSYFKLMESDTVIRQQFMDYITINVSEFFRNPEYFETLGKLILPELLRRKRTLRIWSAACSYGQEPYSLAILLSELTPLRAHTIIATDIDARSLENTAAGQYSELDVKNVSAVRLSRWFTRGEGTYTIDDRLRSMLKVQRHDLLKDPYPENIDLIVCRNVAIYFTDEAKKHLFRSMYHALVPGGYLFVGGTERIQNAASVGYVNHNTLFYQRPYETVTEEKT